MHSNNIDLDKSAGHMANRGGLTTGHGSTNDRFNNNKSVKFAAVSEHTSQLSESMSVSNLSNALPQVQEEAKNNQQTAQETVMYKSSDTVKKLNADFDFE
jgi:hypothetical protein